MKQQRRDTMNKRKSSCRKYVFIGFGILILMVIPIFITSIKLSDRVSEFHIPVTNGWNSLQPSTKTSSTIATDIVITTNIDTEIESPAVIGDNNIHIQIAHSISKPVQFLKAQSVLKQHPLQSINQEELSRMSLEDAIYYLHKDPICANLPIFVSMATVFSDLYWQLIENFIYTMVKFDTIRCSLMICVSDANCMRLCRESNLPCFDYQYTKFFP
eukprot:gene6675-13520_t